MGKSIWEWLEIEPTSDIKAIKAAYAEVSKKYHPAEHPEEFKRLRDSYKEAVSLAKSVDEHWEDVISENSFFHAKNASDAGEASDEGGAGEKYIFNIDKEKEDAGTSKYDFSSLVYDGSLSDRQKDMLSLLKRLMSCVQTDPNRFGNEKVIKAIMYNWDKPPYKEEITPLFTESVLNIVSEAKGLGKGAAGVIEKILFADSSDSQIGALYSRFRSIFSNIDNINESEFSLSSEDVKKCFCKAFNYSGPIIDKNIIFGAQIPYNLAPKIAPMKDILLICDAKAVRYYFSEELSYSIDARTDTLTVYDFNDEIILKIGPHNTNYQYLLDYLVQNGSRYIGEKDIDETGYVAKLEDYSVFWKTVSFYGISTLMIWPCLIISADMFIFSKCLEDTEYAWVNGCSFGLLVIFGIALLALNKSGGEEKCHKYKILFECIWKKWKFKKDIANKEAEYVLGRKLFIFKRYIVFDATYRGFVMLPIEDIEELKCETEKEPVPTLVMKHYNGTMYYCSMYPSDVVERVIDIINKRKEELKEIKR